MGDSHTGGNRFPWELAKNTIGGLQVQGHENNSMRKTRERYCSRGPGKHCQGSRSERTRSWGWKAGTELWWKALSNREGEGTQGSGATAPGHTAVSFYQSHSHTLSWWKAQQRRIFSGQSIILARWKPGRKLLFRNPSPMSNACLEPTFLSRYAVSQIRELIRSNTNQAKKNRVVFKYYTQHQREDKSREVHGSVSLSSSKGWVFLKPVVSTHFQPHVPVLFLVRAQAPQWSGSGHASSPELHFFSLCCFSFPPAWFTTWLHK